MKTKQFVQLFYYYQSTCYYQLKQQIYYQLKQKSHAFYQHCYNFQTYYSLKYSSQMSYYYCTQYFDNVNSVMKPCGSGCCIAFDWCASQGSASSCTSYTYTDTSTSIGSIIGGVVGGFFFLVFLSIAIVICYRRRMASRLLSNAIPNRNNSQTTIIMNNQQPAYGVNYSGYGVTQSSSQPMYNQAIHYNQGVYNSKMFPQQAHQSQAAYNLPVAQSYGQVQYGGGYQQANPFIRM